MAFDFGIPTNAGPKDISVEAGSSLIFVGANGGGKTRLAVYLEELLGPRAHRISAHRALALNPNVSKISEEQSLSGLWIGNSDPQFAKNYGLRANFRWKKSAATSLLNDFDFLLQALFAEQSNRSLVTHKLARAGTLSAEATKFEILSEIWHRLLPQRELVISGDDIRVSALGSPDYSASDMSDGERAVFYLVGQVLVAKPDSLLIVDEPELHIHRAILSKLWDELEAARPDCAFVFITHELEFASRRPGQKFSLRSYAQGPVWDLEEVPDDSGFSEEMATLILGSRRPILFVEGDGGSLDVAIYRACYPKWTVIPRGSCEEVIFAVRTLTANAKLNRLHCSGIVDGDGCEGSDREVLASIGVHALSVSEVENIFLLPEVVRAIAQSEGFQGADLNNVLANLEVKILEYVGDPEKVENVVMRHCKRRIDRALKNVDLSEGGSVESLAATYRAQTDAIDIAALAAARRAEIQSAVAERDLTKIAACFDDKGLMAILASALKRTKLNAFEGWISRSLRSGNPQLSEAVIGHLPSLPT